MTAIVCGLKFDLAFDGTPANNVEITFGRDEDGDGSFSPAELALRCVLGQDAADGARPERPERAIRRRGLDDGNCGYLPMSELLNAYKN